MRELSLHLLDIAENSISAGASRIVISVREDLVADELWLEVSDNGKGMSPEMVEKVLDPFVTSRTTRKVGLGVPFLKMTSEQTGGSLDIYSEKGVGTEIKAVYKTNHPDCIPLGDLAGYLILLLIANPGINFAFTYEMDEEKFEMSTRELKENGIEELSNAEMSAAVKEYINENLKELFGQRKKESYLC